jgi:SCP-2 sterol transfer family
MPDAVQEFFEELSRRGHEPLLEGVTGTIRFDLETDHRLDRWVLHIEDGDLSVTADGREADSVVFANKALFERIVTGAVGVYAAWVRNELQVERNLRLAFLFRRLMPGQPLAHHPRNFAAERRHGV